MMDKLRSWLWINRQRLKRGHIPTLRWAKNEHIEARRSRSCPVAQMLPLHEDGWVTDVAISIDDGVESVSTPEYLARTIRRFDREASDEL